MACTVEGGIKVGAMLLGISQGEYRSRKERGEKWCTGCKAWHATAAFRRDRTRRDGLSARCLASQRRPRTRRDPAKENARKAVAGALRRTGKRKPLLLAHPGRLACHDCGHLGPDRRHEYDHHLGYAKEHWLDVQPVCTVCHAAREMARRPPPAPLRPPPEKCCRGHSLAEVGVYMQGRQWSCRQCRRENMLRFKAREEALRALEREASA